MSDESVYCTVTRGDDGEIVEVDVEEPGYITRDSVNDFKYFFSAPSDITESLAKSRNGRLGQESVGPAGRVSYSSCTVHYPDGMTTSTIVLTGCVLQYRPNIKEDSRYGIDYVTVGMPVEYGSALIKGARDTAGMKAEFKGSDCDGYYWSDMDIRALTATDVQIVVVNSNGEGSTVQMGIMEAMKAMESSVTCDLICNVSASATTKSVGENINPKLATYYVKPKPISIYLKQETSIKGPQLALRRAKNVEKVPMSQSFAAAGNLAAAILSRMKLGDN